jgi:hypothetical protein
MSYTDTTTKQVLTEDKNNWKNSAKSHHGKKKSMDDDNKMFLTSRLKHHVSFPCTHNSNSQRRFTQMSSDNFWLQNIERFVSQIFWYHIHQIGSKG